MLFTGFKKKNIVSSNPKQIKWVVALGISKADALTVISRSTHFVNSMQGTPLFPSPVPDLGIIKNQTDLVRSKHEKSMNRTIGSAPEMQAELEKLRVMLKLLGAYVESIARGDTENAVNIILSAGMDVKKLPPHPNRSFQVKPAPGVGRVKLSTKAEKNSVYHYQQTTTPNNPDSWITTCINNKVKCIAAGFVSGVRYYFRVAIITNGVQGNWSSSVNLMIN
jgi:hypothetical protein